MSKLNEIVEVYVTKVSTDTPTILIDEKDCITANSAWLNLLTSTAPQQSISKDTKE